MDRVHGHVRTVDVPMDITPKLYFPSTGESKTDRQTDRKTDRQTDRQTE